MDTRGSLSVEGLLKIVLVLVIIWLGLEVLGAIVDLVFGRLSPLIGLVILLLIVLWFFDRI
ncbi:MAG: hypothetical protein ABEJ06_03395 [Haloarculaceae archaeon]